MEGSIDEDILSSDLAVENILIVEVFDAIEKTNGDFEYYLNECLHSCSER